MLRVLLSHAYFYQLDPKQWATAKPYPPLGTLYAASVIRSEGFPLDFFDSNLAAGPDGIATHLSSKPDVLVLYDDGFNYLTKMCLTAMRDAAFEMMRMAKQRGCHVLVSGSDATDQAAMYLEQGADAVIIGEGEYTLKEVLHGLESGTYNPAGIPGLAYLENGTLKKTAPREVLRDLDVLPDPAWDLVNMDAYRSIWKKAHGYFSLNMATTRGCPFKCNWCAKPIYGNRYHSRSPERVAAEMAMLMKEHGATHFWMSDDIFGLKPGWVQRFREALDKEGVRPRYKIQSRVDLLLQDDTLQALASSGAEEIWVGAESGSQHVLDAMDKGTTVEQIHAATRAMQRHGIRVGFFLQLGYPGETREDIRKTMAMVDELMPDDIGISVSYPLPGTPFHERVKAELSAKANWVDSDDLALMFRSTFPPEYYRRLHRYMHKRFRRSQARRKMKQLLVSPGKIERNSLRTALSLLYYYPASWLDAGSMRKWETTEA